MDYPSVKRSETPPAAAEAAAPDAELTLPAALFWGADTDADWYFTSESTED